MADFRTLPDQKPVNEWALRTEKHRAWVKWMWRLFFGGFGLFFFSIILFSFLTPSFKKLEDPSLNIASEVIAQDDSTVLGRLYVENRAPVRFENIPKNMVQALMATEDSRFQSHSGIDPEALLRVFAKTFLMAQSGQGGGSTLTMQLAKLLYSDRDFKDMNFIEKAFGYYYRKLSEMITAVKLERAYTKEEIITMYLNTYDFGYNAHGIRAASEVYFSKAPEQLTFEESATLVGMCNNSSLFNPIRRNEKTKQRRNLVLARCFEQNIINAKQYKELITKPLDVSKFKNRSHNDGLATYFRTTLADDVKKLLTAQNITKADGTLYDVYRDGLKIHTSIDPEMQAMAEASMREHMTALQAKYFKVWKGRDPWTYKGTETTDAEIQQRQASLDAQIRNSDRYTMLRSKYLDQVLDAIEEDLEGNNAITDSDILNMLKQERQANYFDSMLKSNSLNPKRVDLYRKIMSSSNWSKIKVQWGKIQADAKVVFNTPVKMKVFAYNLVGEKDTTMTPMDSIRYHRMHLQLGSLGIDPQTGFVKFWVGGIGHKYFQVDHVRVDRQVGSTFKPFVYATAIAQFGMSPCQQVHDVPQTISVGEGSFGLITPWTPKNSTGYSGGYMTLWDALKESRNTASVYLMKQIGSTQPVREIVHEMGIEVDKMTNNQYRLPKTPAICLGAADLTVLEMTGGYTTFANNGVYIKPQYIRKITDKSGRTLYQEIPKKQSALPENAAFVMLQMLKYNVRGAPGIKNLKSEIGGKTGTTNDFRDGWFMGVTPKMVVGTWVGGEDQWIRFLRIEDGQGAAMARPFFTKLMEKVEKSPKVSYDMNARFKKPAGDLGITLNCGDYYRSGEIAPDTEGGGIQSRDQFQDEESSNLKPKTDETLAPNTPLPTPKPSGTVKPPPVKPAAPKPKADDGFQG